jgi:lipoprotein signal peptidase
MTPAAAPAATLPAPERSARATAAWLALAVVAGAIAAAGTAPAAALFLLLAVTCAVGVLHSPFVFVWLLTAQTGIGFGFFQDVALRLGAVTIHLNGLRWAAIAVACTMILVRYGQLRIPRYMGGWIALTVLAAIGIAWSPVRIEGIKQTLLYVMPLLITAVAWLAIRQREEVYALRTAMYVALVIGAAIGLVPFLAGGLLGGTLDYAGRPLNRVFGYFLLPVLALGLARLHRRPDALHAALVAAVFALGLLTLSRTTILAMLLMGALLIVFASTRTRLLAGGLLLLFFTTVLSYDALRGRILASPQHGFTPRIEVVGRGSEARVFFGGIDTSGRGMAWLHTTIHALQSPWLGHGTGSASEYVARITRGVAVFPHNEFLRAFHDWGAVGLAVSLLVFAVPIIGFNRIRRRGRDDTSRELALAAMLTWVGFVVTAVFDNTLLYYVFFTHNVFLLSVLALKAEEL